MSKAVTCQDQEQIPVNLIVILQRRVMLLLHRRSIQSGERGQISKSEEAPQHKRGKRWTGCMRRPGGPRLHTRQLCTSD